MDKKLVLVVCALSLIVGGWKCSREHVQSVEMMNKCIEYHRRQLYPQAIRDCSKAVSLDPENEKAQHALAVVYIANEEYEQAARSLQRAIALNSGEAVYHHQLGEVYQWLHNYEQAASALEEAVRIDDRLFRAHYRLGRVYEAMGEPEKAMRKYTDSLMRNGKFFDAYRELGSVYLDYHFLGQAEQVFREGLKALEGRGEELATLQHLLGVVFAERKDYETAVKHFREALEIRPDMEDAMFSLGWSYSYTNRETAKIWLRRFVEQAGQDTRPDYLSAANARLAEIELGAPIQ